MTVDKVKPLCFETLEDGTQKDYLPTEADPNEDYLTGKGFSFENRDDVRLEQQDDEAGYIDTKSDGFVPFNKFLQQILDEQNSLKIAHLLKKPGTGFQILRYDTLHVMVNDSMNEIINLRFGECNE